MRIQIGSEEINKMDSTKSVMGLVEKRGIEQAKTYFEKRRI
jgi:hypothetical protein